MGREYSGIYGWSGEGCPVRTVQTVNIIRYSLTKFLKIFMHYIFASCWVLINRQLYTDFKNVKMP